MLCNAMLCNAAATLSSRWSEKGVRLAQKMQVGLRSFLWGHRYRRRKLAQRLG
jgi:hypothetical protein